MITPGLFSAISFVTTILVPMATAIPCVRPSGDVTNPCPHDTDPSVTPPPMFYSHPEDCAKFYQCVMGQPEVRDCCQGTVFNDQLDMCLPRGSVNDTCSRQHAVRECQRPDSDRWLLGHPTACHKYYNCSKPADKTFRRFEDECEYPEVFDLLERKCVHYEGATCGEGRATPTWKCDYARSSCPGHRCRPCYLSNPSCVGKEDGMWAYPHRPPTPSYIQCKSGRFVTTGSCPHYPDTNISQFFQAEHRRCVPLWEVPTSASGYRGICEGKESGYHVVQGVDTLTYRCPQESFHLCPRDRPFRLHRDIHVCRQV